MGRSRKNGNNILIMTTLNPKYNLHVKIKNKTVLRATDNMLNRIQIKHLFEGENYKLIKV